MQISQPNLCKNTKLNTHVTVAIAIYMRNLTHFQIMCILTQISTSKHKTVLKTQIRPQITTGFQITNQFLKSACNQ